MVNKLKYIFVFFIFLLISFFIIKFPKTYFSFNDQRMLNNISKKSLNLENIYDNYNLTNDEKIDILFSDNYNNLTMLEVPTRENYEHNINNVKDELEKINPSLAAMFKENFMFEYENLNDINITKNYLSGDNYKGLTIKNISYSDAVFYVVVLMDAYDNTIFSFSVYNSGVKNYILNFDASFETIDDDFRKYLNVNKKFKYIVETSFNPECSEGCEVLSLSISNNDYKESIYDKNGFDY